MSRKQEPFHEYLEGLLGKKLSLKINDNRSTMLSVKWEPDCTKVSLHRIFLEAPSNVMEGLACYLNQSKEGFPKTVRNYIEENLKKLDYSHTIDKTKLMTQGTCFNLKMLYDEVNSEYFNNRLELLITWFGRKQKKAQPRSRLTLGLFHDQLRLIKVNRFLDRERVPEFLVSYVIYHEMLHYVCPSYVDERGIHRVHSKEFRAEEEKFRYFNKVQEWMDENQTELFA